MRPLSSDLNTPRIDSYRFSMANMEESPDMDLDAILTELCALESQYDEAIQSASKSDVSSNKEEVKVTTGGRTHSPDNDSAFSDSVSLLSSESSASSGRTDLHTQVEGVSNTKADKIRLALQKMKDASVKKLFIKVFSGDGSGKSLLVDEGMSCGYVTRILAEKNHRQLDPQCALVESLTDLHMERVYEDHEPLVEQLMLWTRDSKNKLIFSDRPDERTLLFRAPHLFIGPSDAVPTNDQMANSEMLEEFFSGSGVPSVEGPLYIKTESRKGWKKYHCMLRASGLYYWPKDKAKSSSKDLVCLATFDVNHVSTEKFVCLILLISYSFKCILKS
ncbi:hypothetical protein AAG570_005062 [Ranatra chinensis]|uniref:Ras-associating domain-containing protein n=1 Tax=Ranatra chinensis TaxID=642074 RepID=A0ABD0Y1W6_9HEMI